MISHEDFLAYLESDGEIEFDLYAQDPDDWAPLVAHIPGLVISSAGGFVPFQAEGLLHGLPFYFRERHDQASLQVGQADGDAFTDFLFYAAMDSDDFRGMEDFPRYLIALVQKLERAPMLWKFPARKLKYEDGKWNGVSVTEETESQYGWGMTPEEGYAATQKFSEFLGGYGWSEERQKAMRDAQQISPVPVNQDDRVWPDPLPEFTAVDLL